MSKRYTATYWSHELADIQTITQEFEGTIEEIADSYFQIMGDILGLLVDEEGNTVYENMKAVREYEAMWEY